MPWNVLQSREEKELAEEANSHDAASEQPSWGLLGSVIAYFVDGGRHCCTLRVAGAAPAEGSAEVWRRVPEDGKRPSLPELRPLGSDLPGLGSRSSEDEDPQAEQAESWEWPAWCRAYFEPCIEVYVVDDETGRARWVEAMPRERVKDSAGRDEFLSAEYMWDGELYIQDFAPEHVRRRGGTATVRDFLERGEPCARGSFPGGTPSDSNARCSVRHDGGGGQGAKPPRAASPCC
mmetsp:Transcript_19306/g.58002  ORF Transcript_19306/g.58002 Transcript_19306/m.58002 type:complete len:234 (+) Transcript_19306:81-782(+)